jgi:hypothetical protein
MEKQSTWVVPKDYPEVFRNSEKLQLEGINRMCFPIGTTSRWKHPAEAAGTVPRAVYKAETGKRIAVLGHKRMGSQKNKRRFFPSG